MQNLNLNLNLNITTKSLTSFHEILSEPYSPIIRDTTLLRFQHSVEVFWRLLKDYLCIHEGFICESPKSCIKMAFTVGLMDEETVQSLEMIDKKKEIRPLLIMLTLKKPPKKSTDRLEITGNLWTRFSGALSKEFN